MATTTVSTGAAPAAPRALDRASWGALFAGFFVGVGTLFLLLSLGAAIGFTAIDPRDLGSWKTLGIGAGVWGGVAAIVAAFFSAWVAARLCTATDRAGGILHGVTLWGLTWAVALWVGAMAIGGAVSSAAGAAGAAGGALSQVSTSAITDEAVQQANAWLRQQGKPEVPREQMQAAMQAVASDAMARVRSGESPAAALRQENVVASLAQHTNLSRADAEELAAQVRQQLQGALSGASENAPEVASAAASGASKGAWGAFAAALLTLLASALGGAFGIPARARREAAAAYRPAPQLTPQHT